MYVKNINWKRKTAMIRKPVCNCDIERDWLLGSRIELGGGSFGAEKRPSGFLHSELSKVASRVSVPGFSSLFLHFSSSLFITEVLVFIMLFFMT